MDYDSVTIFNQERKVFSLECRGKFELVATLALHLLLKHALSCHCAEQCALGTCVSECPALAGADVVHVALVGMLIHAHRLVAAVKVLWILLSSPPPSLRNRVAINTEAPISTCNDGLNAGSWAGDPSIHLLGAGDNGLWRWFYSITGHRPEGAVWHVLWPVTNLEFVIEDESRGAVYLCGPNSSFIIAVTSYVTATVLWVEEDALSFTIVVKVYVNGNWLSDQPLSPTARHITGPVTSLGVVVERKNVSICR